MPSNSADAKGCSRPRSAAAIQRSFSRRVRAAVRWARCPTATISCVRQGGDRARRLRREHRDVGSTVRTCLDAAQVLAQSGIEAEVIDLRTLVPLDEAAIIASLAKTGRLVVVDESRDRCGAGSYVAAIAADKDSSI